MSRSLSDYGMLDLLAFLFDSEAVFLGSLVILGGFVAMGQRVKNIIECDIPFNHHTVWEKE